MRKGPAQGKLFVISAPSGSGKTTLCNKLFEEGLKLNRSISVTTRAIRKGEKEGVDYIFVSKEKFDKMAGNEEFLEYEENFGNFYATPRAPIDKSLKKGESVVLNIDVKGAMKVRRAYPDKSVLIFILPPSIADLKERLKGRKSDGEDDIERRLDIANTELSYTDKYDYTVVNDALDAAYKKLKGIILKELGQN